MRIALIVTDLSNTRIGGISRVATEIGANYAELGHEVIAYVLARQGCELLEEVRGIQVRYIESFATLNADYPVIGFARRAFARFLKDAETERFDVVHSFNLNAVGAIRHANRLKELRIPFVVSNYETLGMDVRAKLTEFFSTPSVKTLVQIVFESLLALIYERRYLRIAHRIITEDENTRRALVAMNIDEGLIRLIPSGVDVEHARETKAPDVDVRQGRSGPVIGYIGRVDPRKGVQYLIAAMRDVLQHFPGATLFLAGGSRHGYDKKIHEFTLRHGLTDCVRILGRVPGDIMAYYKLADVIVIPSLSEGIPITLGEAMASEVPVVITRLPGVVPFVKPSDLVYWADIANSRSIGCAIGEALSDSGCSNRVRRALQFINDYTWRAVAERHLAVYRELAAVTC